MHHFLHNPDHHLSTHFLDEHDTAWMLALAGIAPEYTMDKLASIHTYGGYLQFPVLRQLTPPKQFHVKTEEIPF